MTSVTYSQEMASTTLEYLKELHHSTSSFDEFNSKLEDLSGIKNFFISNKDYNEFIEFFRKGDIVNSGARDWGDIQTPKKFTDKICKYLLSLNFSPNIILEPTYGIGNFIFSSIEVFPKLKRIYGIEIRKEYEWMFKISLISSFLSDHNKPPEIILKRENIFSHTFDMDFFKNGSNFLIIGNPPWVTNTELSSLDSSNVPPKSNFKKFKGIDAMTGKSNFDLGEYIILQLLNIFSNRKGKLAMLCKNIVIKNIVKELPNYSFTVSNLQSIPIDAKLEFGRSVDASLLILDLGQKTKNFVCNESSFEEPNKVLRKFGWVSNSFVSDTEKYLKNKNLDGTSTIPWRGGIKHDCSPVLELTNTQNGWLNGLGESVDIESDCVYPLLKGSKIKNFLISKTDRGLIVTQKYIGQPMEELKKHPKLWKYLEEKSEFFSKRKSKIYRKNQPFSIFGVGEYSFKPYKVAIPGMYKDPHFAICIPVNRKPFVFDDTCYFLGFEKYDDAIFTCSILNSKLVKDFLLSLTFVNSKRPFTKEILSRLDLGKILNKISFMNIQKIWDSNNYENLQKLTDIDYQKFKKKFSSKS